MCKAHHRRRPGPGGRRLHQLAQTCGTTALPEVVLIDRMRSPRLPRGHVAVTPLTLEVSR
jgi:hypothetical protein